MNKKTFSHRRTLLPFLAKKLKAKNYLEIGVKGGKTFLPIKVRKKYAVDPQFRIKSDYKRQQITKYPFNLLAKYFECTSDVFFEQHAKQVFQPLSLKLAFIDGLHTYEQTYKDIENTLPFLHDDGIILLHDCSPKSTAAAYPAQSIDEVKKIKPEGFDGLWSGDVWKVVPRLKLSHPHLDVFVIDHDSGLGVISKSPIIIDEYKKHFSSPDYSVENILQWSFEDLIKSPIQILNIINDDDLVQSCRLFNH